MRLLACAVALGLGMSGAFAAEAPKAYPKFAVDPLWPKQLPDAFIMGDLAGIGIDAQDHVWVLTRQKTLDPTDYLGAEKMPPSSLCCRHAPAVIEFDPDGNMVQGWGGPYTPTDMGATFEWPDHEHGLTVDYKGNIWICGNGKVADKGIDDNQCLKFSKTGKFLLQIGHSGKSKGSLDPENLNHPSQVAVWQKTNEVFISDGYVNRRVAVFDNDTGKFKRMWGAYGKAPDDKASKERTFEGPPPQQFNLVHGIKISNDGLVYVSDRQNNRIQVFTLEGKFVRKLSSSAGRATSGAPPTARRFPPTRSRGSSTTPISRISKCAYSIARRSRKSPAALSATAGPIPASSISCISSPPIPKATSTPPKPSAGACRNGSTRACRSEGSGSH